MVDEGLEHKIGRPSRFSGNLLWTPSRRRVYWPWNLEGIGFTRRKSGERAMRCLPVCFVVAAAFWLCSVGSVWGQNGVPGLGVLNCEVQGDTVHLTWELDSSFSVQARLERDGETIAELAAGDVSYDDVGVSPGTHVYRLLLVTADGVTAVLECEAVVGEGFGIKCEVEGGVVTIRWDPLPIDVPILAFLVSRDNRVIATLGPDATSHRDEPPGGEHVYAVGAVSVAQDPSLPQEPDIFIGSCRVLVKGPPGVTCSAEGNVVTVRWEVPENVFALGFVVSRDNVPVAFLGPDARVYREEAPPGWHTYTVATNNVLGDPNQPGGEPPDFLIGSCRVFVESGPGIHCSVEGNVVTIVWELPDDPVIGGVFAPGFIVTRDGQVVAELGADARSYSEEAPPGEHVYTVAILSPDGTVSPVIGTCRVFVEGGTGVQCSVERKIVTIRWALPADIVARGFLVRRDGEIVAMLDADARMYREEAPPGMHEYTVTTNNRPASDFLIGSCRVFVEGVQGIQCSVEGNVVKIEWEPLDATVPLVGIGILRDGALVAQLPADALSYSETAPPGEHLYTVFGMTVEVDPAGNVPGENLIIGRCQVLVEGGQGITCEVEATTVSIRWEPPPVNVAIRGYVVTRDGQTVATLGPDTTSYTEEAPPGVHVYTVLALTLFPDDNQFDPDIPGSTLVGTCRVVVEGEPGLPPPQGLRCSIAESVPIQVQLFWMNPVRYGAIHVTRNGQRIAVLEGSATRFSEVDPGPGRWLYGVFGVRDGEASEPATCIVEIQGPPVRHRLSLVSHPPLPAAEDDPNGVPGLLPTDALTAVLSNSEPVQAWSFGICSDSSLLEVASATIEGTTTASLNDGEGPSFIVVNVHEGGVTVAVVIDETDPGDVLPPAQAHTLLEVGYQPGPDAVEGEVYRVNYCAELGEPPVAVVVVVDGFSVRPATSPGAVLFGGDRFLRGDSNNDGEVNMSDGIHTLDWLFRGGSIPVCLDAADANGTRDVNIADPVYLFQALFIGGPPPPFPYPECGRATAFLGCEESACND